MAHDPSSYESLPYESQAFVEAHPDCLATVAAIFGLSPPAVENCRVLELGCASGGNLIPMAFELPAGRFVGIDYSPRQIAEGQATIDALGLTNIELRAMSLLDVDEGLRTFDYIIAHGLYSWVAPELRQKLLALCGARLDPQGLAYVSFNTYPGWHLRSLIRDLFLYRVREVEDPRERVAGARAILDLVAQKTWDPSGHVSRFLIQEAARLRSQPDSHVFHDYLEEVNQPVYFHEFVRQASAHGLNYVGDARIASMAACVPAELRQTLQELSSVELEREQYLDFLRTRAFRRAILCRAPARPAAEPKAEPVTQLQVITRLAPQSAELDLSSSVPVAFRTMEGATLSIQEPLFKAALWALSERWPLPMPFAELLNAVRSKLARVPSGGLDAAPRPLAAALLHAFIAGWLELHRYLPPYVREPGKAPRASALARYQAERATRVVNLRHQTVELTRLDRHVVQLLDGQHDRPALIEALERLVSEGSLDLRGAGPPPHSPERTRTIIAAALEGSLHRLASSALLID